MILLATVLAVNTGPSPSWPVIAAAAAILALLGAVLWQGREIVALRDAVKKLQEPPPPVLAGRHAKPMFSGLYAEKAPNALAGFGDTPGAPMLAIAGLLVLAALGLGLTSDRATSPAAGAASPELMSLRAALDSVAGRIHVIGDSLRLVTAATPASAPVAARPVAVRRMASRPTTTPASPAILPAPSLPGTTTPSATSDRSRTGTSHRS